MNGTHPKALAAAAAAEVRKADLAVKKAFIAELSKMGMRFVELGSHTIAYVPQGKDVIAVATTIRHPGDRANKILGRWHAAKNFSDRRVVCVKKHSAFTPKEAVLTMFCSGLQ